MCVRCSNVRRMAIGDGQKILRLYAHKLLSRILIFISVALSIFYFLVIFFIVFIVLCLHGLAAAAATAVDVVAFAADDDDELTMSIKFPFNLWPNIKPILNINYTFWSSIRFFRFPDWVSVLVVMDDNVIDNRHTVWFLLLLTINHCRCRQTHTHTYYFHSDFALCFARHKSIFLFLFSFIFGLYAGDSMPLPLPFRT